ncbi:MAG: hypothetical protein IT233_12695 [Bacteroidia bacterium]|nr:hypothetical protein [Bacteroidia bacterium]
MTRNVPHQNSFDTAKLIERWQFIVLLLSTAATITSIALNTQKTEGPSVSGWDAIDWANASSSFFAVGYIVLEILINDKFYNSGKEKRLDLVDHAFDTNFSGEKSTGYFNPGGINKGIYKLAVLSFENSLFTSVIIRRMIVFKWIVAIIISGLFIFSACLGNKELVNNLLQIAATGILVQQAIRLQQFSNRMGNIHSDFKALFNDLKDMTDKSSKEGEMVRNILNYEATHSWGSILLNSNTFAKLNPTLSKKWDGLKQNYKI